MASINGYGFQYNSYPQYNFKGVQQNNTHQSADIYSKPPKYLTQQQITKDDSAKYLKVGGALLGLAVLALGIAKGKNLLKNPNLKNIKNEVQTAANEASHNRNTTTTVNTTTTANTTNIAHHTPAQTVKAETQATVNISKDKEELDALLQSAKENIENIKQAPAERAAREAAEKAAKEAEAKAAKVRLEQELIEKYKDADIAEVFTALKNADNESKDIFQKLYDEKIIEHNKLVHKQAEEELAAFVNKVKRPTDKAVGYSIPDVDKLKHQSKISQDEYEAVSHYIDEGGANSELRNDTLFRSVRHLSQEVQDLIRFYRREVKLMDSVVEKSVPLPHDAIVYRGVGKTPIGGSNEFIESLKPGVIFIDKSFMSTATNVDKNLLNFCSGDCAKILRIKLPKGTKGIYGGSERGGGAYSEFILPRNSKIKVVSQEGNVLDCEYILP